MKTQILLSGCCKKSKTYMRGILVVTVGSRGWGSTHIILPPFALSVHNLPLSSRGRWGRKNPKGQNMCRIRQRLNSQAPCKVVSNVRCMGIKNFHERAREFACFKRKHSWAANLLSNVAILCNHLLFLLSVTFCNKQRHY